MANDEGDDNRVGYGRPPRASRFRKGVSGNPSGRRRGQRNIQTLLDQELATRVTITEGGRRRRLTKAELVAMQVVTKAAQGEWRFVALLLNQLGAPSPDRGEPATDQGLSSDDEAVLRAWMRGKDRRDDDGDR